VPLGNGKPGIVTDLFISIYKYLFKCARRKRKGEKRS
jgi:hypothetical protein